MRSTVPPKNLSWLSPSCRPTRDEVRTYAAIIAAREGGPLARAKEFEREAELQLWVWRNENQRPPPGRHPRKAA